MAGRDMEFFDRLSEHSSPGGTRWYASQPISGGWIESDTIGNLDEPNQYFSVCTFEGGRRKAHALPLAVLWADYDEGLELKTLETHGVPEPSVLWETSPGRFQALWLLNERLPPPKLEMACKALQRLTGSDETWDATRMMRVPGSIHQKQGAPFRGSVLIATYNAYDLQAFPTDISHAEPADTYEVIIPDTLPEPDFEHESIPLAAQKLLLATTPVGQRHRKLYHLACLMIEAGVQRELTLANLKASVWNKFSGRSDEMHVLTEMYEKAIRESSANSCEEQEASIEISTPSGHSTTVLVGEDHSFELVDYKHMLDLHRPDGEWLVDGWWPVGAQGLVVGSPKSYKSTILLDMCVSIAAELPFLGSSVNKSGPILMIQEENDPLYLADMLRQMATYKGIGLETHTTDTGEIHLIDALDIPIYMAHFTRLDLTNSRHQNILLQLVERVDPVMTVLDSLYSLLGRADESSNTEVRPALAGLTRIRAETGSALAVVHHKRKAQENWEPKRIGDMTRGAGTFHAWLEAAWYVDRANDHSRDVTIQKEFRMFPTDKPNRVVVAQERNKYALLYEPNDVEIAKSIYEPGEIVSIEKFEATLIKYVSSASLTQIKNYLEQVGYIEFSYT